MKLDLNKRKTSVILWIYALILFMGHIGVEIAYPYLEPLDNISYTLLYVFLTQFAICGVLPTFLYVYVYKDKSIDIFSFVRISNKPKLKYLLFTLVFAIAIIPIATFLGRLSLNFFESKGFDFGQLVTFDADSVGPYEYLFRIGMLAIMPAFFTEYVHRGLLLRGIQEEHGTIAAIFISALFYTLSGISITTYATTFIIGLAAGVLAITTRSIIYPMFLYFINNWYWISMQALKGSTNRVEEVKMLLGVPGKIAVSTLSVIIVIICLIISIIFVVKHFNKTRYDYVNSIKFKCRAEMVKKRRINYIPMALIFIYLIVYNIYRVFMMHVG